MRRSVNARIISVLFTVSRKTIAGARRQRQQQVGDLRERVEERQDAQNGVPLVDPDHAERARRSASRLPCVRITPFGSLVVPDV